MSGCRRASNGANKFRLKWVENYEGSHGHEYTREEWEDLQTKQQLQTRIKKIKQNDDLVEGSIEWVRLEQEVITEWNEGRCAYVREKVDVEIGEYTSVK